MDFVPGAANALAASFVAGITAPDDTNENILYTYSAIWTPNTVFRWTLDLSCVNNANDKNVRVRLNGIGGTIYYQRNTANTTGIVVTGMIANRGAVNSQEGAVIAGTTYTGTVLAWGKTTSAVDTSVLIPLVVTVEKATSGDTVTLERFHVERLER